MEMLISIITVTLNSATTIERTIQSVLSQSYSSIEYIVVDGVSTDNTLDILEKYFSLFDRRLKYISEPDTGIYDAMNKGFGMATGSIVGYLNSDDFFKDTFVVEKIVEAFNAYKIDAVFGNVLYIKDSKNKVKRKYSGKNFHPGILHYGVMPPHPSFYAKRSCYLRYGLYNTNFYIAGDFELLLRFFLKGNISYKYLDIDMVVMRLGGVSTRNVFSILCENSAEILQACKINDIYTNRLMIYSRFFLKVWGVLKWLFIPYYISKR